MLLFTPYGDVTDVHVAINRDTERSRGIAFVVMPDSEQAHQAMLAIDDIYVGSRRIVVEPAAKQGVPVRWMTNVRSRQ